MIVQLMRMLGLLGLAFFAGLFTAIYEPGTTVNMVYVGLLFVSCIGATVCGIVVWSTTKKLKLKGEEKDYLPGNRVLKGDRTLLRH